MTAVATRPVTYMVTMTDSGQWLHAPGSDFLFAYIEDSWSQTLKDAVSQAFVDALQMSNVIKKAVLDTSGQEVVNGLYLLDQSAMTTAMNSIPGMGETSVDQHEESGDGTAVSINAQFFAAILAGLGGDVAPILGYLNQEMATVQAQTAKSTVTSDFGTVIGLVSVMPVLDVVVTAFQYAYSAAETANWFTSVTCGTEKHYSYDYKFTVVNYNYDPTS